MSRYLLAALLLLAAAPSLAAQSRTELLLSDAPSPSGRRCEVLRRSPREYAAALDSVAMRRAVGTLPTADSAGTVLYSVRWDERGNPVPPVPIENGLTAEAEARIREIVAGSVRAVQASESWSLRVRIDRGPAGSSVRIGRSELCRVAQPRRDSRETVTVTTMVTAAEAAELQTAGDPRVTVRVAPSGVVIEARLTQSSGSRLKDEWALEAASRARFLPALVDGIAVEAAYEVHRNSR